MRLPLSLEVLCVELSGSTTPRGWRGRDTGVYFMLDGDEVVYIGQSWSPHERTATHRRNFGRHLRALLLPARAWSGWAFGRSAAEYALIEIFKPRFNKKRYSRSAYSMPLVENFVWGLQ